MPKRTDNNRMKDISVPVLLLAMTLGICGPIQLYLTNMQELWFSIKDIWWLCLLGGIALFAIGLAIGMVLPSRMTPYYSAGIFGVSIGLYVQGNFVPTNYGVLDGREIDWAAYRGTAVINSIVWLICVIAPLMLIWKRRPLAKQVIRIASIVVIAMQTVTVGTLLITNNLGINQSQGVLTYKGINEVSSQGNVVVFVLDSFDEEYFEEIYEQERDFLQPLEGFTWFENSTGMYPTTKGALPYILTQQVYKNEQPYENYLEEAYKKAEYYTDLKKNGYDIGVYTLPVFMPSYADEIFMNYSNSNIQASSNCGLAGTLYKFTCFRYFPHCLKKYVWFYSGEFDQWREVKATAESGVYSQDNLDYYQQLNTNGLSLVDQKKCFRFIHISGTHPPYSINEFIEEVSSENVTRQEVVKGSLNIVYEYLRQLKSAGVYDNTTVLIISDHGSGQNRPTNPIFLVKPRQSTGGLQINSAPVCQEDIIPTIMEDIGLNENEKYGTSAFNVRVDSDRERFFLFYEWDDSWDKDYLPEMTTYGIMPQSNDPSSFYLIDYPINPYALNTPISFDASNSSQNALEYMINGFGTLGNGFTWTVLKNATMAFDLQETPSKNLLISLEWKNVCNQKQRMIVKAGETVVYNQVVTPNGSAEILVSKDLLEDGTKLRLNFELPDAISPHELTGSDDTRILGVGFASMMIKETELTGTKDLKLA